MKKSFLILAISLWAISIKASVLTVYNGTGKNAQYTSFDAAYTAAANGDTIMLYGSPTAYTIGADIAKSLTIIGPGWAPLNNGSGNYKAVISGRIYVKSTVLFEGVQFGEWVFLYTSGLNSQFIRCYNPHLNWQEPCDGVVVKGCYFDNEYIEANGNVIRNLICTNNLWYRWGGGNSLSGFYNVSNSNILINHNLFHGGAGPSIGSCVNVNFTNNIFVNINVSNSTSQCNFAKNDFYNSTVPSYGATNSDGGGNITSNPQMVDQVSVDASTNNPLLDFTIKTTVTNLTGARGTAGDGKDMGLLYDDKNTSTDNFTNCRISTLPYVSSMNIQNATISAGGTLTVDVVGKRAF